ncbi:hypothetical protein L9G74_18435 [Shewanella sp. C32]|uniref:HTH cro/C1-type domain-containing protein n=1 Tax=Shewanella electrica TaxID=515560 RepID=A0ABT2FQ02_9GAMM|nr:hypothetical protein [Shewanella electrica]MCH1925755.1 hypothetical protein [Shewanella electrica]MCS4558418.1 hypothetical protein [Shewanella electrica]
MNNDALENIEKLQRQLLESVKQLDEMKRELNRGIDQRKYQSLYEISSTLELGKLLAEFRIKERIEVSDLALQSDASRGTISRILDDPKGTSIATVLTVIEALGGKLCIAK